MQRGPYILIERIGQGGMGEVWRARRGAEGPWVALKRLTERGPRLRRALTTELVAAGRLAHPGIVRMLDRGFEADGEPWLVTELCSGSLAGRMFAQDTLPELARQLLDALAHAHARGVVHRDLKPSNLLERAGRLKLADFGIAAAAREHDSSVAAGTPGFMAPEQREGRWRDQGPWTDLFALGRTLRALVGPELPEVWQAWLDGLTAPSIRDRFPSAADALYAMRDLPDIPQRAQHTADAADTLPMSALFTLHGAVPPASDTAEAASDSRLGPPIPAQWRTEADEAERRDVRPQPAVFGRVAVPFVGRLAERDQLWRQLHEARDDAALRVVLLRGPQGVGRSMLGEWFAQRTHEVGAAHVMRTSSGLSELVQSHFRLGGLDRDAALARVGRDVGAEGEPEAFLEPEARATALSGRLETLSRERSVVVWLDDLESQEESLQWVTSLLGADRTFSRGVVVVGSLCDPELADRPAEAHQVDGLSGHAEVHTIALEPLGPDAHRELVHQLVGLSAELSERLAEHSLGDPGFAVEVVQDWIHRGALVPTEAGLELAAGQSVTLPASGSTALRGRLDRLCEGRDAGALAVAAVLGPTFEESAWLAVCSRVGAAPGDWLTVLADAHVLRPEATGWAFTSARQLDAVRQRVASALPAVHLEVAAWRGVDADPGERGRHLLEAGQPAKARSLLLEAARDATQRRHFGRAHLLLEALGRSEPTPAQHAEALVLRGGIAHWRGDATVTLELARRGWEAAEAVGDPDLMARAIQIQVRGWFGQRDLDRALAALDDHPDLLERVASESGQLHVLRAHILARQGHPDGVDAALDRAEAVFTAVDDAAGLAETVGLRGYFLWRRGELEQAEPWLRQCQELYRDIGDVAGEARALNSAGNVAWRRGDLDTARARFERALELQRRIGGAAWTYVACNLGVIAVEQGRSAEGQRLLNRVVGATRGRSWTLESFARSGLFLAAVQSGDARAVDAQFAHLVETAQQRRLQPPSRELVESALALLEGDAMRAERTRAFLVVQRAE